MPLSPDALLATCWTTAGDAAPDRPDQHSPLDLRERAEAASAAGFTGFGLVHADLVRAEREYGYAAMRSILRDNGLDYLELEALTDWWTAGPARTTSDAVRRTLLQACDKLGAHHIKIHGDNADGPLDRDSWAEQLAGLAADAEAVGAKVGIEFLPWSNIKTVHDAVALCDAAGHPGAGVIVDVWHVVRGGTPAAELTTVPVERIVGVELNDADAEVVGTLFEDTVHRRRLCGQGSFDLPAMVAALRTAGWIGPWGVEILSDDFRRLPVRHACATAYRTTRAVLG